MFGTDGERGPALPLRHGRRPGRAEADRRLGHRGREGQPARRSPTDGVGVDQAGARDLVGGRGQAPARSGPRLDALGAARPLRQQRPGADPALAAVRQGAELQHQRRCRSRKAGQAPAPAPAPPMQPHRRPRDAAPQARRTTDAAAQPARPEPTGGRAAGFGRHRPAALQTGRRTGDRRQSGWLSDRQRRNPRRRRAAQKVRSNAARPGGGEGHHAAALQAPRPALA